MSVRAIMNEARLGPPSRRLRELITQSGQKQTAIALQVFGKTEKGQPRRLSSLAEFLGARHPLPDDARHMLAAYFHVDPEELAAIEQPTQGGATVPRIKSAEKPTHLPGSGQALGRPPSKPPPRLSLQIDADGVATLNFTIITTPHKALELLQLLDTRGLIGTAAGGEPFALAGSANGLSPMLDTSPSSGAPKDMEVGMDHE